MTVRVKIVVASSGSEGVLIALLDLGCTRCLVSPQVVDEAEKVEEARGLFPTRWFDSRWDAGYLSD